MITEAKKLVDKGIELSIGWMHVHRYLYEIGQPIISDQDYNGAYECHAIWEGVVGKPEKMPPIPEYSLRKEEEEWSGKPRWDHMAEWQRRKK